MSGSGATLRAVAAKVGDAVCRGESLDRALDARIGGLPGADRSLAQLLAYTALRRHWQLREWQGVLLSRPLKARDSVIAALLDVGLVQLTDTRVPAHAAVAATVEAARRLRRPKLAGLVNACLRRFLRDDLATRPPASDAARTNHPNWLLKRLAEDWPDAVEAIVAANNARAPMWLRLDTARCSVDDYRRQLKPLEAEPLPAVPGALRLGEPLAVDALPQFAAGVVSVQDAAAQLAAPWLLQGRGGRILDACAAPGGKTGHLLELGANTVVAVDSDAGRLLRVAENLQRLGRHATIVAADASKPGDWFDGEHFDGILLDAPCSATGVIRRHPDIKLCRRDSDIGKLARRQAALVRALWPLLRPGGRLLYATCSVLAAENDAVTTGFLREHGDAFESDLLPNNNIRDLMRRKACGYQILPGTAGMDGFYYACLEKKVP